MPACGLMWCCAKHACMVCCAAPRAGGSRGACRPGAADGGQLDASRESLLETGSQRRTAGLTLVGVVPECALGDGNLAEDAGAVQSHGAVLEGAALHLCTCTSVRSKRGVKVGRCRRAACTCLRQLSLAASMTADISSTRTQGKIAQLGDCCTAAILLHCAVQCMPQNCRVAWQSRELPAL